MMSSNSTLFDSIRHLTNCYPAEDLFARRIASQTPCGDQAAIDAQIEHYQARWGAKDDPIYANSAEVMRKLVAWYQSGLT